MGHTVTRTVDCLVYFFRLSHCNSCLMPLGELLREIHPIKPVDPDL